MPPLIGIPTCLDVRGRRKPGRSVQYLDTAYARAVAEAGGTPVHLAVDAAPEAAVARLDGLLLPGGGDLLPPRPYPARAVFEPVPELQLAFDRAVLAAAEARELPVLGICYGMQLMALHHGGELHYDVACDLPDAASHQLGQRGRHRIALARDSRLAALFACDALAVNSRHHQAVAEAGDGLRISARSDDGVAEALEAPEHAFRIGVQWHPEDLDPPHRVALFGAFVSACA